MYEKIQQKFELADMAIVWSKIKQDMNELIYIHNIYNPSPLIYTVIYIVMRTFVNSNSS